MRKNLSVTEAGTALTSTDYLISRIDLKSRIVFVNLASIRISGYLHEELMDAPRNLVRHPDMPEVALADSWTTL